MSREAAARDWGPVNFQPPLTYLPQVLRRPDNAVRAVAIGWLLAFVPSILLALLVSFVLPSAAKPEFEMGSLTTLLLVVVFAPLLETLIMGTVLLILLRLANPTIAVLVSAIGWGIAHSLAAPAWGLVIWWPFLIFSTLFVVWSKRSLAAAVAMPALVHGLHNLPSALLLYAAPGISS